MITISEDWIEGLISYYERFPQLAEKAAILAVNTIAPKIKTYAAKDMQSKINLPPEELGPARFKISTMATATSREAVIRADPNPLGMSRFVKGNKVAGAKYPVTQIKRNGATHTWGSNTPGGDYAFLIATPNGNAGVALALRTNRPITNSHKAKLIKATAKSYLYIIYGPSTSQMFGQLSPGYLPKIGLDLQAEFARQFARLQNERS